MARLETPAAAAYRRRVIGYWIAMAALVGARLFALRTEREALEWVVKPLARRTDAATRSLRGQLDVHSRTLEPAHWRFALTQTSLARGAAPR